MFPFFFVAGHRGKEDRGEAGKGEGDAAADGTSGVIDRSAWFSRRKCKEKQMRRDTATVTVHSDARAARPPSARNTGFTPFVFPSRRRRQQR